MVQSMMEEFAASGRELGLQLAVYLDGKLVVDAWAGVANPLTGEKVAADMLFPVFSVTKGVTTTVIHQLVERGLLDYDMRLAEVWPEFGAHGKDAVTLRHALTHMAGIPELPPGLTFSQMLDWPSACGALAAAVPKWPAGKHFTYHAKTFGWMLGEVARRVDGRFFSDIVREDIARPLGLDTLHMGLRNPGKHRVAFLVDQPLGLLHPLTDAEIGGMAAAVVPMPHQMNHPATWAACLPSTNALMNARAIARHYAALLPGGVEGVELLPPERVSLATRWETLRFPDGGTEERGLGYHPLDFSLDGSSKHRGFGHGGYGGSAGFACPELRLAVGYTHNLLGAGHWEPLLARAMRELL